MGFALGDFFSDFETFWDYLKWQFFPLESKDRLAAFLANLKSHLANLKQEEKAREPEALPGEANALNGVIADFSKNIERLEKSVASSEKDSFDEARLDLRASFESLYGRLVSRAVENDLAAGPTKDKPLNYLIYAMKQVRNGTWNPDNFNDTLDWIREHLRMLFRNFRQLRETPELFPELSRKLDALAPAYENAKRAFSEISEQFSRGSFENTEKPFALLQEFCDPYHDLSIELWKDSLEKIAESQKSGEFKCIRCGNAHLPGDRICRSCGFLFLPLENTESFFDIKEGLPFKGRFTMTANIERLLNAVEDFQEGVIGEPELMEILNWMEDLLQKANENYEAQTGTPEEVSALLKEGAADLNESLALFRAWRHSQQDEEREKGIRVCLQGAEKIQQAISMSLSAQFSSDKQRDDFNPPQIDNLG